MCRQSRLSALRSSEQALSQYIRIGCISIKKKIKRNINHYIWASPFAPSDQARGLGKPRSPSSICWATRKQMKCTCLPLPFVPKLDQVGRKSPGIHERKNLLETEPSRAEPSRSVTPILTTFWKDGTAGRGSIGPTDEIVAKNQCGGFRPS